MSFRTRRIKDHPWSRRWRSVRAAGNSARGLWQSAEPRSKKTLFTFLVLLMAVAVVFKVMMGVYAMVRDFDAKTVIFAAGADLKKDENGFVNIVLLGDGGHERDGADLVDTIMVVSLDQENGMASMLSIPRDFYVKPEKGRASRINELYRNHKHELGEDGAFELFMDEAGKIADLKIPYYLRVDFTGFVKLIDAIGGIDVDVKEAIEDPYYPNATDDGYTLFKIDAGSQHLDGETALKFVRSRKTTSDFSRAARQQQVLEAVHQKALSAKVLGSPATLKNLYEMVSQNVNTNMSLREMLALAEFGTRFDRGKVISKVLNDDPGQEGGFLYTPERKYYNDQFVLVPFGDSLDLIHRYAQIIFKNRQVYLQPAKVAVLNASHASGLARKIAYQLNRFGFQITLIDNFLDPAGERLFLDRTEWRLGVKAKPEGGTEFPFSSTVSALQSVIPGTEVQVLSGSLPQGADIALLVGDGFDTSIISKLAFGE